MTGSTKILTVSYGTFSCTLEGFDDPLGTMRELAEYFRDLAADDRYFGAEPPTPDVEMLQNIAQRDVQRKVEARTSSTGISLTQVGKDTAKADVEDAQEAPESQVTDLDKGPLTFDDDFLMADEPEDILAVDPDAAPSDDGPAETVAEKLRRLRAVVSRRPKEGEDNSFSQSQGGDAASGKRDRALSETIRQIQDDLSDDEEVHGHTNDVTGAEDVAAAPEAKPEENIIAASEPADDPVEVQIDEVESVVEAVVEVESVVEDVIAEDVAVEDDADVDETEDSRTMAQFLESVSERIEIADDEDENDQAQAPAATTKPLSDASTDADVGRLLEETDNKLNEDGVVRRRQVISQMRAAVAATKADRAVTRLIPFEDHEEVEKKAYRNDLSDAVGVTKPLPEQKSARKLSGPPLVLVSSQRVNKVEIQIDSVEDQPPQSTEATESFARFVKNSGAKGMEELLEAAAAYAVFTKGQESFTRPEIMRRVAMVDPALSISREDGLRSFGQLLRQGKFQRLDRGQFTIDKGTRFNPGKRIAGE